MWSFINDGQCLENAHDSMVDAKAQSDVLTDARFVPFINWSNSIQLITEMFSKTQKNEWRKEIEPSRTVSVGLTVNRRVRGKKRPDTIPGPCAQADYVQNFNAVDRNDRDSADYLTTICTNHYYIRIFCWALDRVIHAAYVIVCNLSQAGMGSPHWKQYSSKNYSRHNFQIDLAMDLMNYGIGLEWDGNLNSSDRPSFMPKCSLVPHDCGKCFFCVKGLTSGITHRQSKKARVTVKYKCGTRVTSRKCTGERVNLGLKSGQYCRMCYQKQVSTELKAKERKERCRNSRLGCAVCKEFICLECWKEGYNRRS
jgi:hypothetical protein